MRVPPLGQEGPLEEGMATHSSVLAWRIPRDKGAWRATAHGFASSWTRLRQLSTDALVCVPSQEKAAFRELIAQLELDPKCRGLPLSSFLILPFQRITRLKLLVQVPDSLPLPPPTSAAARFLWSVQVSAGFLRSPCAPQILIKLLLCAKQWETQPLLLESQILVERETHTHTAGKWSWLRMVNRGGMIGVIAWPTPRVGISKGSQMSDI